MGQELNAYVCTGVAMLKSLHLKTDPNLKLGKTKGVPAKKKVLKTYIFPESASTDLGSISVG
ncbi:hypothetical protein [Brasilonema sp. UFV-L1]|uniref:hypothetical protein n=1 Tax=Brasilonema sp. UFV-L1 TaxID=2234130 RepID=UPI00145E47B3|nr:hypothetical protein [Brasilonema sp. UFV-L1]NMG08031.1 hypothetical protein [Brasilonema sp. UFV-L1]